jgi:hypothetical protein
MDIGQKESDREFIKKTRWDPAVFFEDLNGEVVKLIRDYKGYPIILVKTGELSGLPQLYVGISTMDHSKFVENKNDALIDIITKISNYENYKDEYFNESLNFNKEGNPFEKLNIGFEKKLSDFFQKKYPEIGIMKYEYKKFIILNPGVIFKNEIVESELKDYGIECKIVPTPENIREKFYEENKINKFFFRLEAMIIIE